MPEISLIAAFIAGLLSFLSPCILPIVPFYLSYMAGVSAGQLADMEAPDPAMRRRAVLAALCFAAGIITVFVGLGASASLFGQVLRDYFDILRWVAAALIIAMGLHFLGVLRFGMMFREWRSEMGQTRDMNPVGAYVVGLAFAFGWTPCVGPVLTAVLFMAGSAQDTGQGIGLLLAYGVGMTLPFVLAAVFIAPFMRFLIRFRRHLGLVEKGMGAMLVLFGILIGTNGIAPIAGWMLSIAPDIGVLR